MLHHEQNDDANEDANDDRVGEELCPECQGSMKDSTCAACGYVQEASVAAAFDESKHPRRPKGDKGGGQFTVKENAAGRFEVVDQDTGKKVAETTDPETAQVVADDKNAKTTAQQLDPRAQTFVDANPADPVAEANRLMDEGNALVDQGRADEANALFDRAQALMDAEPAESMPLPTEPENYLVDRYADNGIDVETRDLRDLSSQELDDLQREAGASGDTALVRLIDKVKNGRVDYRASALVSEDCDECMEYAEAVTAAIPVAPPDEWFDDPSLDGPTPITITDDGRIFGHAANWGTCHIGYPRGPGRCVPPPRSRTGYSKFHLGGVQTASGQLLPIGNITLDTGHAPLMRGGRTVDARTAAAHYDDTGTVVADVRAGEDEHGIWFAGALRPDVTASVVRKLLGAKISGDWRGGELVGMLGVNVPGFPVPRADGILADAGDDTLALVAACIVDDPEPSPVPPMIAAEVLAARAEGADPIAVLERIAVTGR